MESVIVDHFIEKNYNPQRQPDDIVIEMHICFKIKETFCKFELNIFLKYFKLLKIFVMHYINIKI